MSHPMQWITAALQTFPRLKRLRLEKVVIVSSRTGDDVSAFEAEVRRADRRGMELIQIESANISKDVSGVPYDMKPLQRSLQWLTFSVGSVVASY